VRNTSEVFAQNQPSFQGLPFVTNYEALSYQAGIQNFDIIQDDLGRIFVANNLGLLEFDGKTWSRYGLNNTKVRSAFLGADRRIYVGSQADFGYLESNDSGQLVYTSLADSLPGNLKDFDSYTFAHLRGYTPTTEKLSMPLILKKDLTFPFK